MNLDSIFVPLIAYTKGDINWFRETLHKRVEKDDLHVLWDDLTSLSFKKSFSRNFSCYYLY